jgi:hypothetical protein
LSSGATAAVDANTKTFAFSAFAGDAAFGLVNRKVLVNFWMSTTDLGDVDVTPSPLVANVGTLLYPPSAALGSERTGWVLTDDTGAFEIEATILGAPGAQYFMASVFNDVKSISNTFT